MLQVGKWVEATMVPVACLGATKVYTDPCLLHHFNVASSSISLSALFWLCVYVCLLELPFT